MFTHHKLKVYAKALAFAAGAQELSAGWGRRHAIVDHFGRAAESIVLNIAEGARLMSAPDKSRTLDYALGSTLECAACLDIAIIKCRLNLEHAITKKRRLLEIARMLIGLRKAWLQSALSEQLISYQVEPSTSGT